MSVVVLTFNVDENKTQDVVVKLKTMLEGKKNTIL